MWLILATLLLLSSSSPTFAENQQPCKGWLSITKKACLRLHQIFYQGQNELYFTGYSWHNRYYYDPKKLNRYNELAWGGGLGKGLYDEDGDFHGVAAFAFLDSHKYPEPVIGYVFIKMLHWHETTRAGVGYSLFVTERPDIWHGIPFPGALPWVFLSYRRATLCATYIPGSTGIGNVLFLMAKWTL